MNLEQRTRWILATTAIGTFMAALDSSVVNLVLPNLSAYYHTSLSVIEWTVMSYLLVISSLLLAYGRLGDMYGHRRIYLLGYLIFSGGSLLCGLAPSVLVLIIFRAVQAIGAGMLMAMGPAIVTDAVAPASRGKALSVTAVAVAVAATVGPVLGGFLTDTFGWRSIFLINLPIGLTGLWLANRTIAGREDGSAMRSRLQTFDYAGAALTFGALIALLLPLSLVEKFGWHNPWLRGSLLLGLVLIGGFVLWEQRAAAPMFDMALFRIRLFSMSNLAALFNYMAQFTIILLIPFYLQQLRGLTPEKAGLLYLPMPLTTLFIAPLSGILSDRVDSRYISSAGMAVMAGGMWQLSNLKADSAYIHLILGLITIGFGIGLFQTPNNSAIMGSVPGDKRGVAAGMLATMRNIGMVLGVAVSGAIFTSQKEILLKALHAQGLSGTELQQAAFTGALHLAYLAGALVALCAVFASLVRGRTKIRDANF